MVDPSITSDSPQAKVVNPSITSSLKWSPPASPAIVRKLKRSIQETSAKVVVASCGTTDNIALTKALVLHEDNHFPWFRFLGYLPGQDAYSKGFKQYTMTFKDKQYIVKRLGIGLPPAAGGKPKKPNERGQLWVPFKEPANDLAVLASHNLKLTRYSEQPSRTHPRFNTMMQFRADDKSLQRPVKRE